MVKKLDGECCESYVAVIWSSPKFIENDYNSVDVRKISTVMLVNRRLFVYKHFGCLQALTEEKYIGRVFATGGMKYICYLILFVNILYSCPLLRKKIEGLKLL
jgi:hypothetical protein